MFAVLIEHYRNCVSFCIRCFRFVHQLQIDVHAYLHVAGVEGNYLPLVFLEYNLDAWLDWAPFILRILFCIGNRANWNLTVKKWRMHGLSDVAVFDAGILLASFARRFLVLVLELHLIHHLFLDRHDACLRRVWLLGFVVLEVAVTQGGRVDLLLADKLLNARVGQHLTLF